MPFVNTAYHAAALKAPHHRRKTTATAAAEAKAWGFAALSCPYAKGRATACIQAYCCVRTKKNTRQPVKNRRSQFGTAAVFRRGAARLPLNETLLLSCCVRKMRQPHGKGKPTPFTLRMRSADERRATQSSRKQKTCKKS